MECVKSKSMKFQEKGELAKSMDQGSIEESYLEEKENLHKNWMLTGKKFHH